MTLPSTSGRGRGRRIWKGRNLAAVQSTSSVTNMPSICFVPRKYVAGPAFLVRRFTASLSPILPWRSRTKRDFLPRSSDVLSLLRLYKDFKEMILMGPSTRMTTSLVLVTVIAIFFTGGLLKSSLVDATNRMASPRSRPKRGGWDI